MPEITWEEMKKFKELLDKEKEETELKIALDEIDTLSARVDEIITKNKSYGSVQALALAFSRLLHKDFKKHGTDILCFSWREIQSYLTEYCLHKKTHVKKSGIIEERVYLKQIFKSRLRERGIGSRVNFKYDTVCFNKVKPKKTIIND